MHEFEVECILWSKGVTLKKPFKVWWKGYGEMMTRGNPAASNIHPDEFEKNTDPYDYGWVHRYDVCNKLCASEKHIKIHKAKAHKQEEP